MHRAKQLNFFDQHGKPIAFQGPLPLVSRKFVIVTWEDYCSRFSEAIDKIAVGEASNSYLYSPGAANRIRNHVPEAKLIAILRHPAERAYSRYLHLLSLGREPIDNFVDALKEESARIQDCWWPDFHYLNMGRYHVQLTPYFSVFPREQIKIYLYEDMLTDMPGMLREIFQFLGVKSDFVPVMDVRYSASGLPKSKELDWVLRKLRMARPAAEKLLSRRQLSYVLRVVSKVHYKNLYKPKLDPETREWMIERYREDTLRLQDLIQRDLSAWLK
jgi:hypothetical protein